MSGSTAVEVFPLSCGATLLVEPVPDVQSAAFTIMVPAGTNYEPAGANGASATLCDLVTRGAGERDSRELSAALDRLGVQRSESVGWRFLSFHGALLAGHLRSALDLYADILLRAQLPEAEFEPSLSGVEQSLMAMEDEPHRKVFVELRRSCYDDPWGRSSEGTLADLPNISYELMQSLYRQCFRPNGTIIGVAGKVDPHQVHQHLEGLLAGWKSADEPEVIPQPRQPAVRHLPHSSTQTHIGLGWEGAPYGRDDYYAAWAAANILGGSSSSRLFTEVRERRGLCYSVSTTLNSVLDEGRVMTYVGTTTERAQETLDVTVQEIRRLQQGVDNDELERCKANAKSSLVMQQESTSSRASSLARDWFYLGRVQSLDEIRDRVQALTVQDIGRCLNQYPPDEYVLITVGERELKIP